MNIQKMMKQAQKMQEELQRTQEELSQRTVEASVGGGKVTVVATAGGDVLSLKIDPQVVDPEDVEFLQDLILSGIQQARAKGRELQQAEMSKVTGGLGLPPGLGF